VQCPSSLILAFSEKSHRRLARGRISCRRDRLVSSGSAGWANLWRGASSMPDSNVRSSAHGGRQPRRSPLAAHASSGLNERPRDGGSGMYLDPGFAARNAIAAIELAEGGAYGSETILDGEGALFVAIRRRPADATIALFQGGRPEIVAVHNKAASACNFARTACQAALAIAQDLRDPPSISKIEVWLPQAAISDPSRDWAGAFERPLQAKTNIQLSVAAALARGAIEVSSYGLLDDPNSATLARMITLPTDDALSAAFPTAQGARIKASRRDGAKRSQHFAEVAPASPDEIRDGFRDAASTIIGRKAASELERLAEDCEPISDAGRIAASCRLPASVRA